MSRPVNYLATWNVPRTDHHARFVIDRRHEIPDSGRVVGEIGVHRHDHLGRRGRHNSESLPIGVAETTLSVTNQHLDPAQLICHRSGDISRPIRARIVDHQDLYLGGRSTHRPQEPFNVLDLVVRRDDDHGLHAVIVVLRGSATRFRPGGRANIV